MCVCVCMYVYLCVRVCFFACVFECVIRVDQYAIIRPGFIVLKATYTDVICYMIKSSLIINRCK